MGRWSRWEYLREMYARYQEASRRERSQLLTEFCKVAGYNRKYALRLLNGKPPKRLPPEKRKRRPKYSRGVVEVLRVIWEAANYPWSLRLKALIPLWLPWVKNHMDVDLAHHQEIQRQVQTLCHLTANGHAAGWHSQNDSIIRGIGCQHPFENLARVRSISKDPEPIAIFHEFNEMCRHSVLPCQVLWASWYVNVPPRDGKAPLPLTAGRRVDSAPTQGVLERHPGCFFSRRLTFSPCDDKP